MPHPFHKIARNAQRLPERMSPTAWERIRKLAHAMWEIEDDGSGPEVVRKQPERVKLGDTGNTPQGYAVIDDAPVFNPGDLVLLFMGGQRVAARITSINGDSANLTTGYDELATVPLAWMRKADPVQAPARTITREDIPVVNPADVQQAPAPQLDENQSMITNELTRALAERGGTIGVRLSPSTILVISSNGGAITGEIQHVSVERASMQSYPSIGHLVQSLGLTQYPEIVNQSMVKRL